MGELEGVRAKGLVSGSLSIMANIFHDGLFYIILYICKSLLKLSFCFLSLKYIIKFEYEFWKRFIKENQKH